MDLAGKILGVTVSFLSFVGVVMLAWMGREWMTSQAVKILRDELKYLRDDVARKDLELRGFREKEKEHAGKLLALEANYTRLEALEKERRIHIFGLERYVKRLETICLNAGKPLPAREDGVDG